MSATDLSALPLPEWVVSCLPERETVEEQAIRIRQEWWQKAVASRCLPGSPPTAATLTRADVWAPAEHVFTLLWRTLAWGSGSHLRQNSQRLNSIEADVVRAEDLLTRAAEESRRDPERAYALLRPRHNEIRGLGPSFFTKFLYFAGGGTPEHPCLILDRVVATALREKCGWESLHRAGPWPPETYRRYCELLGRWAREHHCAADELELTLWRS